MKKRSTKESNWLKWACITLWTIAFIEKGHGFDIELETPIRIREINKFCIQWKIEIRKTRRCIEYSKAGCTELIEANCQRSGRLLNPPCRQTL